MFTRRNVSCDVRSLLSILILFGLITSCAPILVGPLEPNSSLIIGRVVVDNKYSGAFYGGLPLGVLDKGLEVEIESRDGSQSFKVGTEEQGYFFVPNLTPNTYHILGVTVEGGTGRGEEKYRLILRRPIFTPVPGKLTYMGTLLIDLSERGLSTIREAREDDRARAYFLQKYAASPWAAREFFATGPRPAPSLQVAQQKEPAAIEPKPVTRPGAKAERPEWKVGYEWRYAWKRPARTGTFTRVLIREDNFEGLPAYVVRVGKNEHFYVKDNLGELATLSGGKIVSKRNAPYQPLSWPLEIGKEWRNSYTRENIEEKSSQTHDYRWSVSGVQEVKVPAGTFEAFKIDGYNFYTGNLLVELWYSPKMKWFVKERIYQREGVLERELISYKVD